MIGACSLGRELHQPGEKHLSSHPSSRAASSCHFQAPAASRKKKGSQSVAKAAALSGGFLGDSQASSDLHFTFTPRAPPHLCYRAPTEKCFSKTSSEDLRSIFPNKHKPSPVGRLHSRIGLPGLTNKRTGLIVTSEFQIINKRFCSPGTPHRKLYCTIWGISVLRGYLLFT